MCKNLTTAQIKTNSKQTGENILTYIDTVQFFSPTSTMWQEDLLWILFLGNEKTQGFHLWLLLKFIQPLSCPSLLCRKYLFSICISHSKTSCFWKTVHWCYKRTFTQFSEWQRQFGHVQIPAVAGAFGEVQMSLIKAKCMYLRLF